MTMTPWGESSEFGHRKLRGGPGVPREEVERNQRERLYGATVAVVASKGYGRTTVTDLMKVASVSRSAFYRYFDDKEDCFIATLESILAGVVAVTRNRLAGEAPLRERAEAGLGVFMELLATQPDASRLCVVEADAVGPKAVAMVDATVAEFANILAEVFELLPEQRGMPRQIVDVMVGGVRKMLQTRLHRRTEGELLKVVPDLIDLGLSYRPPPHPIRDRAPRGGPASVVERYRGVDEPAQRLELAAMRVISHSGYGDSTMADIAKEARVSLATLYRYFDDKPDLFESAMLRGRLRMVAATIPAYRRAASWPEGIAALVRATLAFLEAEEDFTRLITVDVHRVGVAALEQRDRLLDTTHHLIETGMKRAEVENRIAAEAIVSAMYSMLAARVRSRHKNLQGMAPLAIYMILAPVLGAEEGYRYATA